MFNKVFNEINFTQFVNLILVLYVIGEDSQLASTLLGTV